MSEPRAAPPSSPDISQIPQATTLHNQLMLLNNAIAGLDAGGTVTSLSIAWPPGAMVTMPGAVPLDPPISNKDTIAQLIVALQQQSDAVEQRLNDMGYTDMARKKAR